MLVAAGGIFYQVATTASAPPLEGRAETDEGAERRALEQKLAGFFEQDARPLLAQTKEKDLLAVQRALDGVDAAFKKYEEGVPKFASALTGWGTRFKLLWRKGVETVEGKEEHTWTRQLVQEKFSEHVVSDTRLEQDLTEVMKQLTFELEADRNEMLAGMQTRLAASSLPVAARQLAMADIKQNFDPRLQELLASMPAQSVGIGVGSLAAGIAAEEAVRHLARAVVAQLAARLAVTAAASGGAAGGAAAAGAGGGTAVAPGVGTVIGLAGGFLAGAAVDWWMTEEFEEKIGEECRGFLSSTKTSLLEGESGLKQSMRHQVEQAAGAYEKAVRLSLQPPVEP